MTATVATAPGRHAAGVTTGTGATRPQSFRRDIQGLRAVIICMVVAHHIQWMVFGGVDMSLALSGYLGVEITIREINRYRAEYGTVKIDFWRFYARRARRLLPLAALVTVCTVLATFIWLPAFKLRPVAWDALTASVSGINFRLALNATDYFTESATTSPLQHYWSLGVEEQYWLFLPILLLAAMWVIHKLRLGLWALAVMLGGIVALSLTLSVFITSEAQPWAYFGPETRAWELAVGGLAAIGANLFTRMRKPLAAILGWAGVAAIAYGSVVESHTPAIPGWVMIWSVGGVCLVILAGGANPKWGPALILNRGPLQFIGQASYGWYLWHWPALIIAPYVVGHPLSLGQKVGVALGALVVAIGTYYGIERPIKNWTALTEFPKKGVMLGLRCIGVSALAALTLLTAATVQASTGTRTVDYVDAAKLSQLVDQSTQINDLPAAASSEMSTVKAGLYTECLASETATVAQPCYKGDYSSDREIVLQGSSVAWQWISPLDTIAKERHLRLVIFTKGLCTAERYDIDTHTAECNTWREDAYNKIAALHPALVIMSSHVGGKATPDAIRSSVAFFRGVGAQVLTLGETPRFNWDVPECLSAHLHDIQTCAASVASIFPNNGELGAMQRTAVLDGGGTYLSPLPWMCTNDTCSPVVGTTIVYRDRDHLSGDYVVWVTRVLAASVPQLD